MRLALHYKTLSAERRFPILLPLDPLRLQRAKLHHVGQQAISRSPGFAHFGGELLAQAGVQCPQQGGATVT